MPAMHHQISLLGIGKCMLFAIHLEHPTLAACRAPIAGQLLTLERCSMLCQMAMQLQSKSGTAK